RTWNQFLDWFPDEESCRRYLELLRWPLGFVCPRCTHADEPFRASRGRLVCRSCRYQCSVTAGTVFEKTRTPLRSWFAAVWYVTNQKHGVSALGLQRVLGIGSYQTAWSLLHRLRRAMVRSERERLSGVVEADETYIGGPRRNPLKNRSRKPKKSLVQYKDNSSIIAVAVEIHEPKGFGRVRLRRIPDASKVSLLPFVCDAIEPGSTVRTDGSFAYSPLTEHGYVHERNVQMGSNEPPHKAMPGVHRVASLLKRWLLGTHQGSAQPNQLDYYLDEYTFRFNRRNSRSRGLLFYRLLEQAVITDPVPYGKIIARGAKHNI
ncbi:MAG: IS1595 family transposase, partial [Candidatus Tectomicrobia bacterium]